MEEDESVDLSSYFDAIPGVWATQFPSAILKGVSSPSYKDAKGIAFKGYIRARDGKLQGKIKLWTSMEPYWRTNNGRMMIRVEALLNVSGSRSLEPDPAKLTKLTLTDARKKPEAEQKKP